MDILTAMLLGTVLLVVILIVFIIVMLLKQPRRRPEIGNTGIALNDIKQQINGNERIRTSKPRSSKKKRVYVAE